MSRIAACISAWAILFSSANAQSIEGLCDVNAVKSYTDSQIATLLSQPPGAFIRFYEGYTPLHVAVSAGNISAIALIASEKADINTPNDFRSTPLHVAVMAGNEDAVRVLIKLGANINAPGPDGQTPLAMARDWKEDDIVQILRSNGAHW